MKNKMKIIFSIMFYLSILFWAACASSEQTQITKKEPDVYVFDDIKKDEVKLTDSLMNVPPVQEVKAEPLKTQQASLLKKFVVQLGAFTSKEKAEKFISENKNKTDLLMSIVYRDQVKLFAIQIPPYETKEEAEKVRNSLWQIPSFKDAFILTLE